MEICARLFCEACMLDRYLLLFGDSSCIFVFVLMTAVNDGLCESDLT